MTEIKTGGPAAENLTVRDHFAALAMQMAYEFNMRDFYDPRNEDAAIRKTMKRQDFDKEQMEFMAIDAYQMADEMMKARP